MVQVTGKLTDDSSLAGVEQTPVYLNGKIMAVTDEDGNYSLDAPVGDYRLEIRPREFQYIIRDVKITKDGRMVDRKTGKHVKQNIPMSRATL